MFHRERTGEGQEVEVGMFETMAAFMLVEHANGAMFDPPLGPAVYPRTVAPNRRPYRTSDGYIAALIYNDKHWAAFVDAVRPPGPVVVTPRWRDARARSTRYMRYWPKRLPSAPPGNGSICPGAGDTGVAVVQSRVAVRRPAPPCRGFLRDGGHSPRAGALSGVPTWFSRTPGRVAGPPPNWVHIPRRCSTSWGWESRPTPPNEPVLACLEDDFGAAVAKLTGITRRGSDVSAATTAPGAIWSGRVNSEH
ncbi:coA-transferase III family protein [Mycobacterium kansasii]|uniref:CoA-transferase III family protein n=1 Tax=Mycobacterium kansasii TaxID=1768 RepID=A0A1V3W963_MYCKA|nr:coA-transferase III family protein [Mycobacterium kansasii]